MSYERVLLKSSLLALRSKLSLLLLLLGQQLLLLLLLGDLLLLLLDRSVDVELGGARLPRLGDLVPNEAELLLALVQELLLLRTELQRLQALLNIAHGVTYCSGGTCVRHAHELCPELVSNVKYTCRKCTGIV